MSIEHVFKHLQIRRMHRKRKPPKSREKIDENPPRNEQEVSAAEKMDEELFPQEDSKEIDEEQFLQEDSQVKGLAALNIINCTIESLLDITEPFTPMVPEINCY